MLPARLHDWAACGKVVCGRSRAPSARVPTLAGMTDAPGRLLLVTGARAAGKTVVGAALARSLPRAVHVDRDAIADLVVSGGVPMHLPLSRDALEQLYLRWSAAIAVAETYQQAGFDVVMSDDVFGELFADFVDFVRPAPLHVVMLCPSVGVLRARQATATEQEPSVEDVVAEVARTPLVGLWLDPSGMSVEVIVAQIRDRLREALIDTNAALP